MRYLSFMFIVIVLLIFTAGCGSSGGGAHIPSAPQSPGVPVSPPQPPVAQAPQRRTAQANMNSNKEVYFQAGLEIVKLVIENSDKLSDWLERRKARTIFVVFDGQLQVHDVKLTDQEILDLDDNLIDRTKYTVTSKRVSDTVWILRIDSIEPPPPPPNEDPRWESIGDHTLDPNGSDTIDLWNYVQDKEDIDSQLTFSNINTPEYGAGVSLVGHQLFIIPQSGWSGSTLVTIEVQDTQGGKANTSFLVTVKAPPPPPEPKITITNHLLQTVEIRFDGISQGKVGRDSTESFLLNNSNVQLGWSTIPSYVNGNAVGIVISGHWNSVTAGDNVQIDAKVGDSAYFYLKLSNLSTSGCEVVVNKDLKSEVRQGWRIEAGQEDIDFGYYRLYDNSNVVMYCDNNRYHYWGVFENLNYPLKYDNAQSGLIRLICDPTRNCS